MQLDPDRARIVVRIVRRPGVSAQRVNALASSATLTRRSEQLSLEFWQPASRAGASAKARNGKPVLPRLSVKPDEVAEMLGVSRDYLDEHIKPELRIIRRGPKTILIPVTELVRWVGQSAARWS